MILFYLYYQRKKYSSLFITTNLIIIIFKGFAVGAMFVREVFHVAAKTEGEIMIDNIRAAFKKHLRQLDWMDPTTRDAAECKADAITDMIGKLYYVNIVYDFIDYRLLSMYYDVIFGWRLVRKNYCRKVDAVFTFV